MVANNIETELDVANSVRGAVENIIVGVDTEILWLVEDKRKRTRVLGPYYIVCVESEEDMGTNARLVLYSKTIPPIDVPAC